MSKFTNREQAEFLRAMVKAPFAKRNNYEDRALIAGANALERIGPRTEEIVRLKSACFLAYQWRGLDGDGISDPVRKQLRAALGIKQGEK